MYKITRNGIEIASNLTKSQVFNTWERMRKIALSEGHSVNYSGINSDRAMKVGVNTYRMVQ